MVRNYVKKREPYNKEAMKNAIAAVQSGEMGYLKASKVFGVKRETLRDQVRKRYQKMGPGRDTYLTAEEEDEIEECLKIMARWGFGFSQSEVLHLVGEYAQSREPNNPFKASLPTYDWLYGFFRRHPTLTHRLPEQLKSARAKSSANETIVKEWFKLVEQTFVENNLQNSPHRIFNVDETGMPLDPKRIRVICEKNISHLFRVIGGSGRESITVNGCASADGKMLPPYVVYAAKNLRSAWMEDGPQDCRYTASDKGWMDSICFLDWFEKLFVPSLPNERPVVLIFDGHKSHISVPLIQSAIKNQVILLKLPPNSTHVLQPLDVGVYGPLKTAWEKILISFARQNLGSALTKELFPSLLNKLWISGCLSGENIKAGFARSGIFPFNPDAVPRSLYESAEIFDKVAPKASSSPTPPSDTADVTQSFDEPHTPSCSSVASRPVTPTTEASPKPSIKDFFMQKISPILEAKREKSQNSRKGVKRQYGESLTSEECINRMLAAEEEKLKVKKNKGKGKGKRTVPARAKAVTTVSVNSNKNKRIKPVAFQVGDSASESEFDDDNDEDWVPQKSRKDSGDESESSDDAHPLSHRNVFESFVV